MQDFGLYLILTKPEMSHARFTEVAVRCGIQMLQLREKDLPDRSLLSLACELRDITRGTSTRFIINDRPDIALLCNADGVHLGQEDLPYEKVRHMLPEHMVIGCSTHSLQQAREALILSPDYIGFGPIYPTPTKEKPDPCVGTEQLHSVLSESRIPVVAIGGIFQENLTAILQTGARNMAMVRHFMQYRDPRQLEDAIKTIQAQIQIRRTS